MINEVIKKNGVTYGIILGVILALITATMYAIDLKLFVSGWIGASTFAIYLIIGIVLLINTKKELNGFFSFKEIIILIDYYFIIIILIFILIIIFI